LLHNNEGTAALVMARMVQGLHESTHGGNNPLEMADTHMP
jgi:hypothetical protein